MVLDNYQAHPHVQGLKSVKLVFLPTNTTSVCSHWTTKNLKVHFQHLLVKRGMLPAVGKKTSLHWITVWFEGCLGQGQTGDWLNSSTTVDLSPTPPRHPNPKGDLPLTALGVCFRISICSDDDEAHHLFLEMGDHLAIAASLIDKERVKWIVILRCCSPHPPLSKPWSFCTFYATF